MVYGSTTGNTEMLAEHVAAGLECGLANVTVKNVTEASVDELADYDAIVFGCSTWGEGDLQDDFVDFHKAIWMAYLWKAKRQRFLVLVIVKNILIRSARRWISLKKHSRNAVPKSSPKVSKLTAMLNPHSKTPKRGD